MLVDYEYKNGNLITSYINNKGQIKLKYFPWIATKYVATSLDDPDKSGKYVTWDGKPVKQIYTKYPNKYAIYDFINDLPEEDQKTLFEYNEPDIYFIDIENEITHEKPRPHLANSKILSISIISKNKALVIGIDPLSKKEQQSIQTDINNQYGTIFGRDWEFKYIRYKNEFEMLYNFFHSFVPKMAVMTGWNFKHYDWVFLVNRARKLGVDPSVASFTGKLTPENERDPKNFCELPAHRIIVDYMEIFDKWDTSIKVKESISLDFVSEKVLKVKKVNYEGDLKYLYENDFKKFIFYNAVDSILVQMIHENTGLINILYGISTLSRTIVTKSLSTLNITEGILRKKLKDRKNIVLVKNNDDDGSSGVKGGWVKEPIIGMASWTTCYDFASLYPTSIRQFNISADSYRGQRIKGTNKALFNGMQVDIDPTDIITKNGSVFRNEVGIVSETMAEVYDDRRKYKKIMIQKNIELDSLEKELKELEESLV